MCGSSVKWLVPAGDDASRCATSRLARMQLAHMHPRPDGNFILRSVPPLPPSHPQRTAGLGQRRPGQQRQDDSHHGDVPDVFGGVGEAKHHHALADPALPGGKQGAEPGDVAVGVALHLLTQPQCPGSKPPLPSKPIPVLHAAQPAAPPPPPPAHHKEGDKAQDDGGGGLGQQRCKQREVILQQAGSVPSKRVGKATCRTVLILRVRRKAARWGRSSGTPPRLHQPAAGTPIQAPASLT